MSHKSLITFLVLGMLLALLPFAGSLSCGGNDASSGDIMITSSSASGHTHKVTISGADINNPPTEGKTIVTTNVGYHTHTITLTEQDYQTIINGGEVSVTSSTSDGHTHIFVIRK